MFSHPAFFAGLDGGNTQSQTLLAEDGVPAVTGTEGPDFAGFGELGDVFLFHRSTGPDAVVGFAVFERLTNGVDARNEFAVFAKDFQNLVADAGHDVHIDHNVGRVGDFHTDLGNVAADRTHAVGNHIHGTAVHTAFVKTTHGGFEFSRGDPVVGRTGIFLLFAGDVGTGFHAGHVRRVTAEKHAIGTKFAVQTGRKTGLDHFFAHCIVLGVGAVAPVDAIGFAKLCPFFHPLDQLGVLGRDRVQMFDHLSVSFLAKGY